MRYRTACAYAVSLHLLAAIPAAAQDAARPNFSTRDQARVLANEGFKHLQESRYEEAVLKLRKADQLFHAPTILLQLARAHDKLGQLLEAKAVYLKVVDERLASDAPPEFSGAKKSAAAELASLEKRIPTLVVRIISDVPRTTVEVTLDGATLSPAAEGSLQQNPGRHIVTARVSGRDAVVREITLYEGDAKRVDIELQPTLAPRSSLLAPVLPPAPPPWSVRRTLPAPPDASTSERGSMVPALVGFGVGAAGVGLGAISGALAMSKAAALDARCMDRICNLSDEAEHAAAMRLATASTVGFIVGGVGLGAGVLLLVWQPGGKKAQPDRMGLVVEPTWISWKGGF